MKVFVIWPPQTPSYFNAGHHLPIFSVGNYLRQKYKHKVRCLDAGALNVTWKDIGDCLVQNDFDVIVIANDFDSIDDLPRLLHYIRLLSPRSKIMTFGRLSNSAPKMFSAMSFDGVQVAGDYEAGVADFIDHVQGSAVPPAGVILKGAVEPAAPGRFLPPEEWVLPDTAEIPYSAYQAMYRRDANKFCGIPERCELVVPVARGCPVGCAFCDVPAMQGRSERRLSVERTVDYINENFRTGHFEYVAFYAPTFTLKRQWVADLCQALRKGKVLIPWKCATTIAHLSADLVKEMGASGCVRISVGVETLDPQVDAYLPKVKRDAASRLHQVAKWCQTNQVELNCFVIVGLPGSRIENTQFTIETIRALGARVRPTMYTPYHEMSELTDGALSRLYNRQLVPPSLPLSEEAARLAHQVIFQVEHAPTQVMHRIQRRCERTETNVEAQG